MLRYLTAGESHGKELTAVIEGLPAGLKLKSADINTELERRQKGFGRGARMKIEKDAVEFTGGLRFGETTGAPLCLVIKNYDWENWKRIMSPEGEALGADVMQVRPRPGHADLAAAIKYGRKDLRDILERASARETAARVACGAVAKKLIGEFNISVYSLTKEIGGVKAKINDVLSAEIFKKAEKSQVRTPDAAAEIKMMEAITEAEGKGDTVGGIFTVVAKGVPVGLGSHVQWDRKLDARLAMALMSVQAIKGVEFGLGFGFSKVKGSEAHDEIFFSKKEGFYRRTNNAGGIEGGISNGEAIIINAVMKPIPSLKKPLHSVNIKTKKDALAEAVRSDVCAVAAAGVIGEAVVAFELANAIKEKFGGDSTAEMKRNIDSYLKYAKEF